jgi:chorismate mutase
MLSKAQLQYITLDHDKARASVTVYGVMKTATANGLDPEKYISHLLTVLPEYFAKYPKAAVDDLMPWAEAMQRLCRG